MTLTQDNYKGWIAVELTDEELAAFYNKQLNIEDRISLLNHEYLIITNHGEPVLGEIYKNSYGHLVKVKFQTLGSSYTEIVKPRNPLQIMEFDLINDETIPVKLLTGTWGSFKTGAFAIQALEKLQNGTIDCIYFVRNNVLVKDTDNLGALPGTSEDKMLPYVGPFIDAVGDDLYVMELIDKGELVIVPLGFIRGRNLKHSIIFVDEAENLTVAQILLILARAAEGTQVWINGDIQLRDRAVFEKSPGVESLIDALKGNDLFGYVHLPKSERSEVAALADLLNTYR